MRLTDRAECELRRWPCSPQCRQHSCRSQFPSPGRPSWWCELVTYWWPFLLHHRDGAAGQRQPCDPAVTHHDWVDGCRHFSTSTDCLTWCITRSAKYVWWQVIQWISKAITDCFSLVFEMEDTEGVNKRGKLVLILVRHMHSEAFQQILPLLYASEHMQWNRFSLEWTRP